MKAPEDTVYRYRVAAGDKVAKGTVVAVAENTYGDKLADVVAPADGYILWAITHALVQKDDFIMGLGMPA